MNKIEIRYFTDDDSAMIWIKNNQGQMIGSMPYTNEFIEYAKQKYDAEIVLDERPWYQIDTVNQCWEYQPTDDEESYMSGNFYLEDNKVIDYDGCFNLPQTIKDGLVKLGYDLSEL